MAELRAELSRLNLTVSGNKQELYERLLEAGEIEEDWEDESDWDDEPEDERFDIDFAGMGREGHFAMVSALLTIEHSQSYDMRSRACF